MSHIVVFLHVLSAFVWIGGMIAIRIAVHPVISRGGVTPDQMLQSEQVPNILEPKQRLGVTLQITGRLFYLVIPFILTLLATGLTMAIAMQGHHGTMKSFFVLKEIIWTVMTLNFAYMYLQRRAAWRLFREGKVPEAKAKVALIPNLLLPINIVLGIVALWLGVSLRGL